MGDFTQSLSSSVQHMVSLLPLIVLEEAEWGPGELDK